MDWRQYMKVLIIGGVAAGTKTAAKIKRLNRDAEVMIVSSGKDIYFLTGTKVVR